MNDFIINRTNHLIEKYKTRDPFEIAEALNIQVIFRSLGQLKGFYKRDGHNRYIVINDKIHENLQRIVCAHELGHDQLHRHLSSSQTLQEFMIYDMKSKLEYEANLFAAGILLSNNDVIDYLKQGYCFYEIACVLNTDINLLAIKFISMRSSDFQLHLPIELKSNFLGVFE